MRLFLRKHHRLKSEKDINNLFLNGKSLFHYPIKMIYLTNIDKQSAVKALFSVPKKNFKKAVDRNTLKRRIKEAYRINNQRQSKTGELQLAFIYVSKEKLEYKVIQLALQDLINQLNEIINQ